MLCEAIHIKYEINYKLVQQLTNKTKNVTMKHIIILKLNWFQYVDIWHNTICTEIGGVVLRF